MTDWDLQALDAPMERVERDVHVSIPNNSGAMFAEASNFAISGSPTFIAQQAIYEAGSFQEKTITAGPPGYIPDMTDVGPASPFFTGRQDILLELANYFSLESLSTEVHERKIFILYGMGGAGKTQTALKFINTFKTRFAKCYLIAASSEESIKASFYDIAVKNGLSKSSEWEAGLKWLAKHEEEWIILYDNADDPKINLGQFLPQSSHGNMIVTSRNSTLRQLSIKSKEIKDMAPEDGVQLLLKHAIKDHQSTSEEESMAFDIAAKLHYFALALVHAGSYISQQNCLSTYLERLEKHQLVLMNQNLQQSIDNYSLSVYASWDLSWKRLDEECKTFLRICSCLYNEGISRKLFQRAMDNFQKENGHTLAAYPLLASLTLQRLSWDDLVLDKIIETLSSYSLITVAKEGIYSLHPLVHQWIGNNMDSVVKRNLQLGTQSVIAISISGADIMFLRSIVNHCKNFVITDDPHTDDAMGELWFACGFYGRAYEIREAIWHYHQKKLGESHPTTLMQMTKVVTSLQTIGRYKEALQLGKLLVEISKPILGEQDPDTLGRLQNLARSYSKMGRYDEALEIEEPLLDMSKQILGKQHPDSLTRMHNLAITYSDMGRYNDALEILEPLLDMSKQILKEQHPDTLRRMQTFAGTYSQLGRYNDALQIQEPLLDMCKQILGEEHPHTLTSMQNLAVTYSELGRYKEVLEIEEPLLDMSKQILGEQHPDTLQRMHNLAMTYSDMGRYKEALEIEVPLLDMSKQILGKHHPDTPARMLNLANSYSEVGRYNEALQIEEPLLDMSKQILGEQHPQTLMSMQNLAVTYSELGRYKEALAIEEPLLNMSKQILGEQHPDTIRRMQNLEITYSKLGKYKGLQIEELLPDMSQQTLEEQHPKC
ncbi:hypothetical protein GYMLUDRAFT_265101 [Collybiopsis luxurians FD-317 M1]|uniref:TPR-like protein n=1 Tax=Collybiopsis luxurians FD-317 M1 TaxID=944289 RepID=A0A0D0C5X3_9AGAR|nr:hypothetical protein GYMLUDRAFT_265101 [Collybiopsis luxurians FD-317 M1]